MKLFIDDLREPPSAGWIILRRSSDCIEFVSEYGCPSYISFDHDLSRDDTTMTFIKWLIKKDIATPGFIPHDFFFTVHSDNPVGAANIKGLLNGYLEIRSSEARIYPCAKCGVLRSKSEGGTTFTVCDECWDKT